MRLRNVALWSLLLAVILVPLIAAGLSPQLAWRRPIYIASGFAGIVGMVLLLVQPLLAGRYLAGLSAFQARKIHRIAGLFLLIAVIGHVFGLWVTSPPDMIDALLLRSPTPFSLWGVVAMWAIFGAGIVAILRTRLGFKRHQWSTLHFMMAATGALCSVIHALQIEGTMEINSKIILCICVLAATATLALKLRRQK